MMRTYYIYWMKEAAIAMKEDTNERKAMEFMRKILCDTCENELALMQKNLTKCIPIRTIRNFLKHMMHSNTYYLYHEENTTIYLDETSKASMCFDKRKMVLHAVGSREVELIWFEQLRQFAPTFFVYEANGSLCGWLSPQTQIKNYV